MLKNSIYGHSVTSHKQTFSIGYNTQRSDTDKATYFGLQLLGILFIQH